jgi:hypothetical protein
MDLKSPNVSRLIALSLVVVSFLAFAGAAVAAPAKPAPPVLKGAGKGIPGVKQKTLELVYGDDHVFGTVVPPGWSLDDSSGMGAKIRVVLYPKGQTWAKAPVVMYANPIHQAANTHVPLATMIQRDVNEFQKANPHGKVISAPPITSAKGQTAQVRYFAPDGGKPLEAVAYYEEKTLVQLLVLQSRDAAGFEKNLAMYRDWVATYQFAGTGMATPSGPR